MTNSELEQFTDIVGAGSPWNESIRQRFANLPCLSATEKAAVLAYNVHTASYEQFVAMCDLNCAVHTRLKVRSK